MNHYGTLLRQSAAIVSAALLAGSCQLNRAVAEGSSLPQVSVAEIGLGVASDNVLASGVVVPGSTSEVSMLAGFTGRAKAVHADLGTHVNSGQILLVVDSTEQKDLLHEAMEKEDEAKQTYRLALKPYREEQKEEQRMQIAADQQASDVARAHLDLLRHGNRIEQIAAQRSVVKSDDDQLVLARAQNKRVHSLFSEAVATLAEMETSDTAVQVAEEKESQDKLQLSILVQGSRPEDIQAAEASWSQAKAVLAKDRETLILMELGTRDETIRSSRSAWAEAKTESHHQMNILGHQFIKAPISGTIIQKNVNLGETVSAPSGATRTPELSPLANNPEALFVIANDDSLQFLATVDQYYYDRLSLGAPVSVTCEAIPGRVFSGNVTKFQPLVSADEKSAPGRSNPTTPMTFSVWIAIRNSKGLLAPGQSGLATITQKMPGLLVPAAAVNGMSLDSGTVYVVKSGTARSRSVRFEQTQSGQVLIKSGLVKGERVVVSNTSDLTDGEKVSAIETGAPLSKHANGF